MEKDSYIYREYLNILKEELVPAMGCTEPVSIAFAAARARALLGEIPDRVIIEASGSLIKNAKSVLVPNTGGMKGIEASAAAGIMAGNAEQGLEVLLKITKNQIEEINRYWKETDIKVKALEGPCVFEIILTVRKGDRYARVHIQDNHTNIVLEEVDGRVLKKQSLGEDKQQNQRHKELLNLKDIWEFTSIVDLEEIRPVIQRQIEYNTRICEEGMNGDWGANIGKTWLKTYGSHISSMACAKAAAGSDARMNGCSLPVVINSGSGNQGITVSIPVIEYGREHKVSDEVLFRALVLANLIGIYQKTKIGTLSAFCGAVSAAAAAGAGISYVTGGDYDEMKHAVVNSLAIASGVICDGAKASCAAKIGISVHTAIMGLNMYRNGQEFCGGDGILTKGADRCIENVGRLAKEGMAGTNREIIDMMMEE